MRRSWKRLELCEKYPKEKTMQIAQRGKNAGLMLGHESMGTLTVLVSPSVVNGFKFNGVDAGGGGGSLSKGEIRVSSDE